MPGSRRNPAAAGTNALIADGAHPLLDPADVLLALGLTPGVRRPTRAPRRLASDAARVLAACGGEAATFDQLASRTGLAADQVAVAVRELERGRMDRARAGAVLAEGAADGAATVSTCGLQSLPRAAAKRGTDLVDRRGRVRRDRGARALGGVRVTSDWPSMRRRARRGAARPALPSDQDLPLPGVRPRDPARPRPRGRDAAAARRTSGGTGTRGAGAAAASPPSPSDPVRTPPRSRRSPASLSRPREHRRDVEAQLGRAPVGVRGEPSQRERAEPPLLGRP